MVVFVARAQATRSTGHPHAWAMAAFRSQTNRTDAATVRDDILARLDEQRQKVSRLPVPGLDAAVWQSSVVFLFNASITFRRRALGIMPTPEAMRGGAPGRRTIQLGGQQIDDPSLESKRPTTGKGRRHVVRQPRRPRSCGVRPCSNRFAKRTILGCRHRNSLKHGLGACLRNRGSAQINQPPLKLPFIELSWHGYPTASKIRNVFRKNISPSRNEYTYML